MRIRQLPSSLETSLEMKGLEGAGVAGLDQTLIQQLCHLALHLSHLLCRQPVQYFFLPVNVCNTRGAMPVLIV